MNIIRRNSCTTYPNIFDPDVMFRKAKRLFRKNRLHDAEALLLKLIHHGYTTPAISLLLARVYDRLAFITSEIEFEEKAKDAYREIIQYCNRKKFVRKANILLEKLVSRIARLDDSEHRAHTKAEEYMKNEPSSPKAWFILGANFSTRKDPGFVINAYMNAVALHENYILALFRIGYIYQYNLRDEESAIRFYMKVLKIPPYEDEMESESVNVRTILEACNELTEIYMNINNGRKIISVFDHAMKLYRAYGDICTPHNIKKTIANTRHSAMEMNSYRALLKHCSDNYQIDFEAMLSELGMM